MEQHGQPDRRPPRAQAHLSPRRWTGEPPDPADAPFALDALAGLTHELANLLDGSLRTLGLVCAALNQPAAILDSQLEDVRRRLATVHVSLSRMAELVHAAMQGGASALGASLQTPGGLVPLPEAVEHARAVIEPFAHQHHVSVALDIDPRLARTPCGPLYGVILNGLRNAIESIASTDAPGSVRVEAKLEGSGRLRLEIRDDGAGVSDRRPLRRSPGRSTKRGGEGIGLALSRSLVENAGGTLELVPRPDLRDPRRPGAILRVRCPLPRGDAGSMLA
jgi:signal transduction histidine kinase